jgi:hypothetical protein
MVQQKKKQQKPKAEEKKGIPLLIVNRFAIFEVHRRLPLEMECEVFKCLKLEIQKKFIWGMGRGIYGIFRNKLLTKVG